MNFDALFEELYRRELYGADYPGLFEAAAIAHEKAPAFVAFCRKIDRRVESYRRRDEAKKVVA